MKIKTTTSWAVALGLATIASPLVATCCPAWASGEDRVNFREFRDLNPDLDKQAARQMFRDMRQNDGSRGTALQLDSLNLPNLNFGSPDVASSVPLIHSGKRDRFLETPRVRNQSLQANNDGVVRLNNCVNLDLTSSERNIVLGRNLFDGGAASVSIKIGNETKTVSAGTQVTAAEYVAVKQVLSGGSQSLDVAKNGVASGGSVDLSALTDGNAVMKASALTVASGVTAYGDFGKGSDFKLTGDLNNFGSVQTFSSTSRNEGAIRADDINNYRGATISSATDLTLDATRNLTNDGVIVSEKGLTLTAGGEVRNSGTVSAASDLNVKATSTINRGLLQSVAGNVNFDADAASQMTVLNTRGTISAENGAINVRNAEYVGSGNSTVFGGDLYSRELNLNAGYGLAEVNVGTLTGVVNESGNAAHVSSSTDMLTLGNICLTGDPTFYNALGDISATTSFNVTETLVIAASGNIFIGSNVNIGARNDNRGFDITLIGGADLIPVSGSNSPTLPGTPGGVIVTGKASKTGGFVQFGSNTVLTSRSISGGGAENAGNISIYAFAGKNEGSGRVNLGNDSVNPLQILAGGRQGGQSGVVTIVAGGETALNAGTAIIDVDGGSGGRLDVITAQPVSSDKKLDIRYLADGTLDPNGARLIAGDKLTKNAVANLGNFIGEIVNVRATNINVIGAIDADTQLVFDAASNITHAPTAAVIQSPDVVLIAGGMIGEKGAEIRFGDRVDSITATSRTSSIYVEGTDPLTVSGSAEEFFSLSAPTRAVSATNLGYSPSYKFEVLKLNSLSFSSFTQKIQEFSLETYSTDTLFGNFSNIGSVSINATGSVGSLVNPLITSNVDNVRLQSSTGAVFYRKNEGKTSAIVSAVTHVGIEAINGINVASALATNGDLNVFGTGGTLTIGSLEAQTQITVAHEGEKAKLVIAPNSLIASQSAVTDAAPVSLRLGPASASVIPDDSIKNLKATEDGVASIVITGNGLKAKKGASVSSGSSDILINNGLKSSAFVIGKSAIIETN